MRIILSISNFQQTKIEAYKKCSSEKFCEKMLHSKSERLWHKQTGSFNMSHQLSRRRLLKYDLFCLTFLPRLLWIVAWSVTPKQNQLVAIIAAYQRKRTATLFVICCMFPLLIFSLPRSDILHLFSYVFTCWLRWLASCVRSAQTHMYECTCQVNKTRQVRVQNLFIVSARTELPSYSLHFGNIHCMLYVRCMLGEH